MSCVSVCVAPAVKKTKPKRLCIFCSKLVDKRTETRRKKMQRAAQIDVLEASIAPSSLVRVSAHGIDQSEYGFSISQQEGDEGGFSQDDVSPNLQISKIEASSRS